jgi:putative acetyltransferase
MIIRDATAADHNGARAVNIAAFGRVDEADLVDRIRSDGDHLVECVAEDAGKIIGHILFSRMSVGGTPAAALAPMAVDPDHQRQGIGSALVHAGLAACRGAGIPAIIVLGHPDYYPRFGFTAGAAAHLTAPFSGPAFMALELVPGSLAAGGQVRYATAFGL